MPEIESTGVYNGKDYRLRVFTCGPQCTGYDAETGEEEFGPPPDPPVWNGAYAVELAEDGQPHWSDVTIMAPSPEIALRVLKHEIITRASMTENL